MIPAAPPLDVLRRAAALVLAVLALSGLCSFAQAQTEIDITGGRIDPLPIAIAPFLAGGGAEESAATIAAGLVVADESPSMSRTVNGRSTAPANRMRPPVKGEASRESWAQS